MQYEIGGELCNEAPESVERVLHAVDSAAIVDRNPRSGALRVSSVVAPGELSELLQRAGYSMERTHIVRLPSECCGGCGG